jgi:hypothetical protein
VATPGHFVLWAADNDSYWTPDLKSPAWCCIVCGSKLSRCMSSPGFSLKRQGYDVSMTYDGYLIGSRKFLDALHRLVPGSFVSAEAPVDKRHRTDYAMVVFTDVVTVDHARSKPELGDVCAACGQYKYVVGAVNYFIEAPGIPAQGIFRTDLEFADGFEKSPGVMVGTETAALLRAERLKGVTLDPV